MVKLHFAYLLSLRRYAIAVQETFGAIRTVRSFAQEDYEISRYSVKVDETLELGLKQAVSYPHAGFFHTRMQCI